MREIISSLSSSNVNALVHRDKVSTTMSSVPLMRSTFGLDCAINNGWRDSCPLGLLKGFFNAPIRGLWAVYNVNA